MHQRAVHSLANHFDDLQDGAFSMLGAYALSSSVHLPGYDFEANLSRSTLALKTFRGLPCPATYRDFDPWLWLGASLLVYARCALGSNASPVRRYILNHLNDLGEKGRELRAHPVIVSITVLEIYECLLLRQMPIMNVAEDYLIDEDAFLGVCFPLVNFSFQLCKINCFMDMPTGTCSGIGEDALLDLEKSVEA